MAQPQSTTTGGAGVSGSYAPMPGTAAGDDGGSHKHISRTTGGAGITGSYGPDDTTTTSNKPGQQQQQQQPATPTADEGSQGGSSGPMLAVDDNVRVPGDDPRAAIALTEPLHHSKL